MHNIIIVLLKKKYYLSFYVFLNFNLIYLTKNSFCGLIVGRVPRLVTPASFASTLATPCDPFANPLAVTGQRPADNFIRANKAPYHQKVWFDNLFYIEISIKTDPYQIAIEYFPRDFHWIPDNPAKDLKFYLGIMVKTNSVFIIIRDSTLILLSLISVVLATDYYPWFRPSISLVLCPADSTLDKVNRMLANLNKEVKQEGPSVSALSKDSKGVNFDDSFSVNTLDDEGLSEDTLSDNSSYAKKP